MANASQLLVVRKGNVMLESVAEEYSCDVLCSMHDNAISCLIARPDQPGAPLPISRITA